MPNDNLLIHPRILSKHKSNILKDGKIPVRQRKVLERWHELITSGDIVKYKKEYQETKLHPMFFQDICREVLGYTRSLDKNKKTGKWTLDYEEQSGRGFVDICMGEFSNTEKNKLVMLELKGADTSNLDIPMKGRKLSTVQQARDYAYNSKGQAKWFIVSNCVELRLYKYPESGSDYECWQIADLIIPDEYERFVLLLGAKNLLSGKTKRLFNHSLQIEKEITHQLYEDYRKIRIDLINGLKRENGRFSRQSMVSLAQILLDRVLFIAYAEDRGLLPDKTLHDYIRDANKRFSAWDMLKTLFTDIDKGNKETDIPKYNGDLFKPNNRLEELSISDSLIHKLENLWEYDFDTDVSVTILGHIFEQSIADLDQIYESIDDNNELQLAQKQHGTSGKRKKDGVVYTPDFITEWIVEHTLGGYLTKQQATIKHEKNTLKWWQAYREVLATTRICDPACGSGAFLVAAFKYLKQEFKILNTRLDELGEKGDLFSKNLNDDILANNLFGVDINSESVEIARLSLWLVTAEKGKPLTSLKDTIRQGNSIINHKKYDKSAFHWTGRFSEFDVVLGNPPYVRQERLSDIKLYLEQHYTTYHGVADLYTYFFELGISIQANLKTIVDFGDLQVFEGVTTYPAILIMSKPPRVRKKPPKEIKLDFWNVAAKKLDDLKTEMQKPKWGTMQQNKLATDGWRLEDEKLLELRQKIIKNKKTLKEVYGSPYRGLLTGLNAAFIINQQTYDQMIYQNPQSLDRLKPFLEGKDLKKWHSESRNLYLILFPKGWTRQAMGKESTEISEEKAWEWLQKRHPSICQWLEPFIAKGRKRGDKGEYWWELRSCTYYEKFKKEKVIYVDIGKTPSFIFDSKEVFCANTAYFIPKGSHFLTGFLNSNIFWFLIVGKSNSIRGGFYRLFTQYMETLPIPNISTEQEEEITKLAKESQNLAEERYEIEKDLRLEIPDLCPEGKDAKLNNKLKSWWLLSFEDFKKEIKKQYKQEIPRDQIRDWRKTFEADKAKAQLLSSQFASKEQELNNKVYALFKLTDEEITLLEDNIQ